MIPDAVVAVVAAIVAENPLAPPEAVGRLVVAALADDGWCMTPEPLCAPMRAELAPCRPKSRAPQLTSVTR
ncbi:hypothetical protein [Streptomyces sp. NPDC051561]|uniref:hypothetical protein n=1 Tax=Streptomyces sp. NPDC051561 TaxID=3365658 RepID=UPI0037BC1E61